jgi:hypothetical protein
MQHVEPGRGDERDLEGVRKRYLAAFREVRGVEDRLN